MLKAIWNNLAEDGMGLVTVPSLEYILEKESYYELIATTLPTTPLIRCGRC